VKASGACISLIKRDETCVLKSYPDKKKGWAIGWGHHKPYVTEGLVISQAWADMLLKGDIADSENDVASATVGCSMTQGRFDALVSWVFQFGAAELAASTLLKKLKAGDMAGAADELLRWVFVEQDDGTKAKSNKLLERRMAERRFFLGGT